MLINETLERRLAFEKLVSGISSRFISFDDIDAAINASLKDMGIFSGASRSYIFLFSKDGAVMDNTHEWCAEDVSSEIAHLKGLPTDMFPWWMKRLRSGEIILIPEVSQLPPEAAAEKEMLEPQGIISALVLPIYIKKELKGFLGFDNVTAKGVWSSEDLSLLQITAEVFSNAFSRMHSEQELRSSERQFRELFHNANDIICVHSLGKPGDRMRFIEVNDLACKMTGYSREEYFTMTPADLCTEEFARELPKMQEAIHECKHITYEMEYVTKSGNKIPVEMKSHTFLLNGEEVVMTMGRDIGEQKYMENELKKNNADLQEVITRLQETQSRLIQQEQLAGIGQLAAGVAHEINNPLAFAMSNCSLLKDELEVLTDSYLQYMDYIKALQKNVLPEPLKQKLKVLETQYSCGDIIEELEDIAGDIYEGLKRVDTIVKSLSTFSRIDYLSEFREYDLQEGIRNTLVVANNAFKYHAEAVCDFQPVPPIKVNPGQINQVLLNLVLNAAYALKVKYPSAKKAGLIKITVVSDERHVLCIIEDNGTGIPEENINKIFNPFFTTKPSGEGTGLGLSIAYDIMVNKHHGDIEVISSPEQGTKFILKFPIVNENNNLLTSSEARYDEENTSYR